MEKRFIMTAFGLDRPGVVADVSRLIYECDGNLEDSTMTRLADEFAIILLFSLQGEGMEEQLLRECRRLERDRGISAFFRPIEQGKGEQVKPHSTHTLHVEGIDHTGIVYSISSYLAEQKVNISNLSSTRTFSPESGTTLYRMDIHIQVPEGTSLEVLKEGLDHVGKALNVDISFI